MNRELLEKLLELHANRQSGVLRLQKDAAKKQLVLHEGRIALAESNQPQEHLARVLVALALLPRTRLREVAEGMKAGKTSEEAVLALSGGPGPDAVKAARREQAVQIVSSLLAWQTCAPQFYHGAGLVKHGISLDMPVHELLLISARRALSKRFVAIPPDFGEGTVSPVADFSAASRHFPLNSAESSLCALIRKPMPVTRAVPAAQATGEAQPLEMLYYLHVLGLVAWEPAREAPAPDSDPAAEKLRELSARLATASHYEVLSVDAGASEQDIRAAYHAQARELHPDRFQSPAFSEEVRAMAERVFARINQAYLTLRDAASRAEYDETLGKKKSSKPKSTEAETRETAEALYREGRSLLAAGDFAAAVERLKGAVWLRPDQASYNYLLGIAESEIPKLRKSAEQHLLRAIELEDLSADSHLALAKLYLKVMLPRKAEQQLQQALRWDPHNAEALKLVQQLKTLRQ